MSKFKYDKTNTFRINRDNLRQLDPKVFEAAARRIDEDIGGYTCLAISAEARLVSLDSWAYERAWKAAFDGPDNVDDKKHPFWNYGLFTIDRRNKDVAKQARMTSLALMATLIRDAKASRGTKKPKVSHI